MCITAVHTNPMYFQPAFFPQFMPFIIHNSEGFVALAEFKSCAKKGGGKHFTSLTNAITRRAIPCDRPRSVSECEAEALQRWGMFSPSLLIPASRFISCSEGVSSAASKWTLGERRTKFHEGEKPSSSLATRIVYNKNTKSEVCFGDDRIMKQRLKIRGGKMGQNRANLSVGWSG